VKDRRKKTVGFIGSAMPADDITRRPSTWNGDIGTSRLEEQLERRLYDPKLIQKTLYWPRCRTNNPVKITDPNVRVGSKLKRTRYEHMTSALLPTSDVARRSRHFAFGPILLQKSFWGDERKFLEPLMRFTSGDVRDHMVSLKIDRGSL
jgi:hypothetical protein